MIPHGCVQACPGCRHRELSEADSLAQKQAWAARNLGDVAPIMGPTERWGYRRKVSLHARRMDGAWAFGMLVRRGREEEFVAIPECPVQAPGVNGVLAACRALPLELPLAFVQVSAQVLTLVLKQARSLESLRMVESSCASLQAAGAGAVFVNWHAAAGRRVLSARHMERVWGPEFLHDGDLFYGAMAFRQQIPEIESEAHALAEEFLAGAGRVLDLYCGLGTTMARWRRRGLEVLGIELVGEACRLAEMNAPGARVLKGKVEERLVQVDWRGGFSVYTNPPRDGHGAEVCAWLERAAPERIAYLSCNMRSLREDLERLGSYRVESAQPFDFFPQTEHVEALVLLRRR